MSVHKRPDSEHWQIRFRIAGRTIRRSSGTADRAAAEEIEQKLRTALWRQIKLGETNYSWDHAVERCEAEDSHQPSWERTQRAINRLNRFLEGAPLKEITRENIVKIRTALERHTYEGLDSNGAKTIAKRISRSTINRDLCALRSILRRCAGDWKMLEAAPKVPLFKLAKVEPRWITRDQANDLLSRFPVHTAGMIRVALATGMRRSDVTRMEWSRVDLKRRTYYVPAGVAKGRGKGFVVPLSAEACEELEAWQGKHSRYVFCFRQRAPIKQVTTRLWRRVVREAGMVGVTFHSMRHSWASWQTQSGTPLRALQEMGGWTSLDMPQRYSHLDPGHLAQYADRTALKPEVSTKSDTVPSVPKLRIAK